MNTILIFINHLHYRIIIIRKQFVLSMLNSWDGKIKTYILQNTRESH